MSVIQGTSDAIIQVAWRPGPGRHGNVHDALARGAITRANPAGAGHDVWHGVPAPGPMKKD